MTTRGGARMKRFLPSILIGLLLLAPAVTPAHTLPPQFGIVAHGVIAYSTASVAMPNTGNETPLNSASGTQINILGRWGTGANNANAINIYGGVVLIGN